MHEKHNIIASVETIRKWMIADGLWVPYVRRKPRIYQPRSRRDCLGELFQLDGSHHDWFEGRTPKCGLLVFVDDASGRLIHLRFGEIDDIFSWQETRKLTKALTFHYDKMIYLVEPTEENSHLADESIQVYDYPDGTLAFKHSHRSLRYQVFDKLDCIDQGQIVDNKWLGTVLKLVQNKMDDMVRQGKRDRSKKTPKRRAQARVQEQLGAINPVLINPEEFRARLRR